MAPRHPIFQWFRPQAARLLSDTELPGALLLSTRPGPLRAKDVVKTGDASIKLVIAVEGKVKPFTEKSFSQPYSLSGAAGYAVSSAHFGLWGSSWLYSGNMHAEEE